MGATTRAPTRWWQIEEINHAATSYVSRRVVYSWSIDAESKFPFGKLGGFGASIDPATVILFENL